MGEEEKRLHLGSFGEGAILAGVGLLMTQLPEVTHTPGRR